MSHPQPPARAARLPGLAGDIEEQLRARAAEYFPDLPDGALEIRLRSAETRPFSGLFQFEARDDRRRCEVLVKIARDGARPSGSGAARVGRPRLVPPPDPAHACLLEHRALVRIEEHFRALGDPRFGAIRVRGLLPEHAGFVMDRVAQPALRALLTVRGRARSGASPAHLRTVLENAGAWLRSYHAMAGADPAPARHASRAELTDFVELLTRYLGLQLGQARWMAWLAATVRAEAAAVLPEALPLGLSHGDFAPRNILVDEQGRVTVCDTRARSRTAIYEDIGHFLASLKFGWARLLSRGLLPRGSTVRDLERAFLAGYFGDQDVPHRAVRLYELLALLDRTARVASERDAARSGPRRLTRSVQLALLGGAVEECARPPALRSPPPRRVLLVGLARGYGGVETRVVSQARALQGAVERCAVAVTPGSPLHERLRAEGIPCEPIAAKRTDPRVLLQLMRVIRRGGYEVVDAHNIQSIFWGHLAALTAGTRGRVTTVHSEYREEYRGFRGRLYPALYAAIRPVTRQFVHVSAQLQQRAEAAGAGSRSTLIHNTVPVLDPDRRRDRSLRAEWGFGDEDFVVAVVGRFFPVKGHAQLIDAMALLRDRPDVKAVLAGHGPLRAELEDRVATLGLEDRVRFVGFRADVTSVLDAADCLCLPSLWENLPYAALEAAACARPIVATAVGGVPEVLTDGETALLVPPRDPAALAGALRALAVDPATAARIGRAAHDLVRRRFSADEMIRRTVDVYARSLA